VSYGIPTTYAGVQFRSRLEARWAAFFDALHWPWAYEAIDLRGYLPDFLLLFDRPLLVEVKPFTTLAELQPAAEKIDRSGWTGEALVVGSVLLEPLAAQPICGILGELSDVPGDPRSWSEARLFACLSCGQASVLAADLSWRCRQCGADVGHVGESSAAREWAEAGNRVQWRGSRESVDTVPDLVQHTDL
jgi:hypothetical protein